MLRLHAHTMLDRILRTPSPIHATSIRRRLLRVGRKIHKIRQVSAGGATGTHFSEMHQLAQNRILQLQLHAVDEGFQSNMHVEETGILGSDDGSVHEDHGQVDDEELDEGASVMGARAQAEEADGFAGVDEGEDDFLDGEADQLDALEDVEAAVEELRFIRVDAEFEDGGGHVEDDAVDDDHGQGGAEDAGVVDDEVEARPEHHGLADDHADPGHELHGDGEHVGVDIVDDQDVAQAEGDDADGGYEEGPEVETAVSFEGGKAEHKQLEGIVPGNAYQTGDGSRLGEAVPRRTPENIEVAAWNIRARHWGIFSAVDQRRRDIAGGGGSRLKHEGEAGVWRNGGQFKRAPPHIRNLSLAKCTWGYQGMQGKRFPARAITCQGDRTKRDTRRSGDESKIEKKKKKKKKGPEHGGVGKARAPLDSTAINVETRYGLV